MPFPMRIFTNRAPCQPGALLHLFYGMVGSRVPVVAIIGPLTVMRATGGVKVRRSCESPRGW